MRAATTMSRKLGIINPGYLTLLLVLLSFASVHQQAEARHTRNVPKISSPDNVQEQTDDVKSACDFINTDSSPCRCDISKKHHQPEVTCRLQAGSTLPTGATSPFSISTLDVSDSHPERVDDVLLAGWMGRVHAVKLQHCDLTVMPQAWLRLPGLRKLDLSHNDLDVFPTEPRPRLRQLYLSHNRLTAFSINYASLRQLKLDHNKLSVLSLVAAYPKALILADLSHNQLHNVPLDMWQGLRHMDLSYNLLSRLPSLTGSSALRELDVSYNKLAELPLGLLSFTPHLHSLSLAGNQLNLSSDWQDGGRLPLGGLKNLNLSDTGLLYVPRALLAETSRLQHLDLSHNRISRLGDEDFSSSGVAASLLTLRLSHTSLRHLHSSTFHHLQHLRHLDLSHNALLGEGLGSHVMLPEHVIVLDLRNSSLRDVDLCQLSHLHELRQLYLHDNPLLCTCHLSLLYRLYGERGGTPTSKRKTSQTQRPWACVSSHTEAELSDAKQTLGSDAVRSPFPLLDPHASRNETNTVRVMQNSNHRTTTVPDQEPARKETGSEPDMYDSDDLPDSDPAREMHAERNETDTAPSVQAASNVKVTVKAELKDDVLITMWDVSREETQVRPLGFRVVCLHLGQTEEQGGAVHTSPVLPQAMRSYALTELGDEEYTVCVDVLLLPMINNNTARASRRICQEVPRNEPIVLVGILAGSIFLLPCIFFLVYITVKDKFIRRALAMDEDASDHLVSLSPRVEYDEADDMEVRENYSFPSLDKDTVADTCSGCRKPAGCQSQLSALRPPAGVARAGMATANVATQTDTCVTLPPHAPINQLAVPRDLPRKGTASCGPTSSPVALAGASLSPDVSLSPGASLSSGASLSPVLPEPDRTSLPDSHDSLGPPPLPPSRPLPSADGDMGSYSDDSLTASVPLTGSAPHDLVC